MPRRLRPLPLPRPRRPALLRRPRPRALIGELATLSPEFRTLWAAHNVRIRHDGVKRLRHPPSPPAEGAGSQPR
ncbi:MmyB family transcriptional regulator [Streptomyces asiaticus]|uniref:MmyB family transcriptional regulator n=1 Tax=Streptomyces asiaticus TaxID=114695 RepID=UPI003F4CBC07